LSSCSLHFLIFIRARRDQIIFLKSTSRLKSYPKYDLKSNVYCYKLHSINYLHPIIVKNSLGHLMPCPSGEAHEILNAGLGYFKRCAGGAGTTFLGIAVPPTATTTTRPTATTTSVFGWCAVCLREHSQPVRIGRWNPSVERTSGSPTPGPAKSATASKYHPELASLVAPARTVG
jgi:hypothetical protein